MDDNLIPVLFLDDAQGPSERAALATRLLLRERRERHRLARQLHDQLQQLLTANSYHVQQHLKTGSSDPAALTRIRTLLDQSLSECRDLSAALSPPLLHEVGLDAALLWLAHNWAPAHGLEITLESPTGIDIASHDVRTLIFAALQESLTNIARHAGTDRAWVQVRALDEKVLEVSVRDHGRGLPEGLTSRSCEGLGLIGIHAWMDWLGGRVQLASRPHQGTRIVLQVPCLQDA